MTEPQPSFAQLEAFAKKWREPLEAKAKVQFYCDGFEDEFLSPQAVADTFAEKNGLKPIGFNWEMLDAAADASGPRSAREAITKAFANDMVYRSNTWLGEKRARECAQEFVGAFGPTPRTIVTNHYDGLWNPISGAKIEWAYVGFDDQKIALLLVIGED